MRPTAGPSRGDVMTENFFPPELVMRHQKELGLTADQQTAIRAEMQKTAAKLADLQWQQSAEDETMQALLKQEHPDEGEILAQLDKVMAVENDLRRAQVGNLVRLKNILTPEQQAKLTELKRMEPRMMPGGMMPGGPGRMGGQPPSSGMPPGTVPPGVPPGR